MIPERVKEILVRSLQQRPQYLRILNKIEKQASRHVSSLHSKEKIKIMFAQSFSIYPPCFIHDKLLSLALRASGAEVIPVFCDGIQSTECNVHGGVWGGDNFKKNCQNCQNSSKKLWSFCRNDTIQFSQYLQAEDKAGVSTKVEPLGDDAWAIYTEDGMPLGQWAKDILVNNYVVADYHLIPHYASLGKSHLKNLLLLKKVYERILNDIKPDRVVANDSFYGMWALWQELCRRHHIPFYSHWSGGRPGAWCYAFNDAAMNLDFSKPWPKYSRLPLDDGRHAKASSWLAERTTGKDMLLDTASLAVFKDAEWDFSRLSQDKPIALLTANVIWDLAALNKQVIFSDMIDWIAQTIQWFTAHPQYQLIVKPHPAELHPSIPETKERVEIALKLRNIQLAPNVLLLSPKVKLTVYQLFPLIRVGLTHTTTVGIEMAASKIPVITSGRAPYRGFGFTLDPGNKTEYFEFLEKALNGEKKIDPATQQDLAFKFILFYNYHYYTKIDIMDYKWGAMPKLKVTSFQEILPGRNKYWDYIVSSIIHGLPIVSEERWPEES